MLQSLLAASEVYKPDHRAFCLLLSVSQFAGVMQGRTAPVVINPWEHIVGRGAESSGESTV